MNLQSFIKMKIIYSILIIVISSSSILFLANLVYQQGYENGLNDNTERMNITNIISNTPNITIFQQGYWARNVTNTEFYSRLYDKDPKGNWIAVNIKNMSYERALAVARHEIGHEMFAEYCEANATLCFQLAKELEASLE